VGNSKKEEPLSERGECECESERIGIFERQGGLVGHKTKYKFVSDGSGMGDLAIQTQDLGCIA
jgi:hypothetical protein